MLRTKTVIAALALSFAASAAQATIVDIPAVDPSTADFSPAPVTASFGPGTYTARVIGQAQGGAYNGWSVATPAPGNWDERFDTSIDGVVSHFNPYNYQRFATSDAALAAWSGLSKTFTLASLTSITFSIPDYLWFDNTGGVSLSITPTAVPEPGTLALFALAAAGFAWFYRRRTIAA